MQGTRLLNTRMTIPRSAADAGKLLRCETFIGTESTSDSSGQVTLSFDIEELRRASEFGEIPTPIALLLCSADARALGKALIDSADVAERLSEEGRSMRPTGPAF